MIPHLGKTRLDKLAAHLERGVLNRLRFDFSTYRTPCGTAGCALGECPTLFPEDWEWQWSAPGLRNGLRNGCMAAQEFFELPSLSCAWHLFVPFYQVSAQFGGKTLLDTATPAEVAANIRAFIAHENQPTQEQSPAPVAS